MNTLERIQNDCEQATFLIERKQLIALTSKEERQLMTHLAGCSICRIFEKQSHMINSMVQQVITSSHGHHGRLKEDYKNRLQQQIDEFVNKR